MIDIIVDRLINIATKSDMKYRHACAIIKGGRIISVGYNRYMGGTSIHAEISAICGHICHRTHQAVVIRINSNGRLAESHPCSRCMDAFRRIGIKRIWYSSSGKMMRSHINRMNKVHISSGAKYDEKRAG